MADQTSIFSQNENTFSIPIIPLCVSDDFVSHEEMGIQNNFFMQPLCLVTVVIVVFTRW